MVRRLVVRLDALDAATAVTPEMALRLGTLFGRSPERWLRRQQTHDLALVAQRIADELARIETVTA